MLPKPEDTNCCETETDVCDAKVGCISIYVVEGLLQPNEGVSYCEDGAHPHRVNVEQELCYVYSSSRVGAKPYYLSRTRNKVLVVDSSKIYFFPNGVEPEELHGKVRDYTAVEMEEEMCFSESEDEEDVLEKVGTIEVPTWRAADGALCTSEATRNESSPSSTESVRRDVFCYQRKFKGEPYYLSFSGNPILVVDKSRIAFFPFGVEPAPEEPQEEEPVEEQVEETAEDEEIEEIDVPVGTIKLRVPVGGSHSTEMKSERRVVFRHTRNKEAGDAESLYFVSRSGIVINIVDRSKVHFYSDGPEDISSEEDLMEEIRREKRVQQLKADLEKEEVDRTTLEKQEAEEREVLKLLFESPVERAEPVSPEWVVVMMDDDDVENTVYPDDPVVGTIVMFATAPEECEEQTNYLAEPKEEISVSQGKSSSSTGTLAAEKSVYQSCFLRLGKRRCKVYSSKQHHGKLYYLSASKNRMFVFDKARVTAPPKEDSEYEGPEEMNVPSLAPNCAPDDGVLVGSLEILFSAPNSEKTGVELRDVYQRQSSSGPLLYYIARTGNKIYVFDKKKLSWLPPHPEDSEEEDDEEEIEVVMGPDDGEDPKVGTILIRLPRGTNGVSSTKERRDVFCSLKFQQKPYYYTNSGNKIYVVESERIDFAAKMPITKTVRRKKP